HCDGAGTCVPGKRFCNATFQALKTAYEVTCQSDSAGSCRVDVFVPGAIPLTAERGVTARGRPKRCPALPPAGASANALVKGTGKDFMLKPDNGNNAQALAFDRKAKLKLSPEGERLNNCNDLQLEGHTTIIRDGKPFTIKRLLPALRKKRSRR